MTAIRVVTGRVAETTSRCKHDFLTFGLPEIL